MPPCTPPQHPLLTRCLPCAQIVASLSALGVPTRLHQGLDARKAKLVALTKGDATGGLPPDLLAISLYLSPDR